MDKNTKSINNFQSFMFDLLMLFTSFDVVCSSLILMQLSPADESFGQTLHQKVPRASGDADQPHPRVCFIFSHY